MLHTGDTYLCTSMYVYALSHMQAIAAAPPSVHLFTINGQFLRKKDLTECLNALLIVDKYLITGNCRGFLTFRDLIR